MILRSMNRRSTCWEVRSKPLGLWNLEMKEEVIARQVISRKCKHYNENTIILLITDKFNIIT